MRDNVLQQKSVDFGIQIIKFSSKLSTDFAIPMNQLLRSGVSIGANISEAQFAESRADFIHKLSISLKEANETQYWLYLLSQVQDNLIVKILYKDSKELCALLVASIKTLKSKK